MIKVLSLFSGIGAFERAFCRIGLGWELVNYCEIDRWASLSYSMVNQCDESLNLRDVRIVTAETVRDRRVDLITYGFPCQDISIAGKQQGFVNNSGESTRSGLFFEALRIIKELRPHYAIAENVKALTSKKFKNEFAAVLSSLEDAGYNNYWSVLNAKDYGIPQNRERVFIVSIRKDVDKGDFQFPEKEPLMLRLRDMLEPTESVDEKYYLSTEREGVRRLIAELETRYSLPDAARIGDTPVICQVGNIVDNPNRDSQRGRIYDPSGLAPTLNTVGGGGLEAKIVIDGTIGSHETDRVTSKDGMIQTLKATDYKNPPKIVIDGLTRDTQKQKARVFNPSGLAASLIATDYKEPPQISVIGQLKGGEKGRVIDRDGIGYTITATEYKDPLKIAEPGNTRTVRIRKITPRECWRLMGFTDEEFNRVHGISNSQLYKQAGNSIVVNVLSALLSRLFYKELV